MTATRTLPSMPGLAGLYARALGGGIPLIGRAPGLAGSGAEEPPRLRVEGVRVDPAHLEAYRRLCGFAPGDRLPATYPQAVAFPLILALLTDPAFPFPALGTLHIGNRIVERAPLTDADTLDYEVIVEDTANHARGRTVTVVTHARVDGRIAWSGEMDLLHRETPAPEASRTPGSRDLDVPAAPPSGPHVWRLPSNLGRRYAAMTGDRNPIHLSSVTARPFGFRRHIAHGMWTHARAMAEIANRLPESYWVDVEFKKPISLPGRVRFGARDLGSAVDFGVRGMAGEPHLLGRVHRPEHAIPADIARRPD
jgi:acyl dehydratase